MRYPARFDLAPEGGFVVTFRDILEAITQGDTEAEAEENGCRRPTAYRHGSFIWKIDGQSPCHPILSLESGLLPFRLAHQQSCCC